MGGLCQFSHSLSGGKAKKTDVKKHNFVLTVTKYFNSYLGTFTKLCNFVFQHNQSQDRTAKVISCRKENDSINFLIIDFEFQTHWGKVTVSSTMQVVIKGCIFHFPCSIRSILIQCTYFMLRSNTNCYITL